jgi:hypothetical protein
LSKQEEKCRRLSLGQLSQFQQRYREAVLDRGGAEWLSQLIRSATPVAHQTNMFIMSAGDTIRRLYAHGNALFALMIVTLSTLVVTRQEFH